MDGLRVFLVVLFGAVSFSQDQIPKPVSEVTVRPGGNITLYCDCKISTGVYIVWYRNCSHENQPTLVLKAMGYSVRFEFLKNHSSESYDLLIRNITDSDEGLYYCGTQQTKVEDKGLITSKYIYNYGNVATRIICGKEDNSDRETCPHSSVVPWMMVVFTPALTILSSFLSFILVYHFCQKTDKEPEVHQKRPNSTGQTRQNQDEDVCLTRVVFRVKDGQKHQ
ncbi:uncharacterized protein LOC111231545 isoform X1 [Seriola dumerili]|uniref:uncharacterized protein LOC111231545 isoform X1 n=1 Tax=Seriola dumerili TaxID=41447 RepID=UPI000BBEB6BA|nr:uncharacterized protein LOC111231545 isoform X1 [Seriola dumerili]